MFRHVEINRFQSENIPSNTKALQTPKTSRSVFGDITNNNNKQQSSALKPNILSVQKQPQSSIRKTTTQDIRSFQDENFLVQSTKKNTMTEQKPITKAATKQSKPVSSAMAKKMRILKQQDQSSTSRAEDIQFIPALEGMKTSVDEIRTNNLLSFVPTLGLPEPESEFNNSSFSNSIIDSNDNDLPPWERQEQFEKMIIIEDRDVPLSTFDE